MSQTLMNYRSGSRMAENQTTPLAFDDDSCAGTELVVLRMRISRRETFIKEFHLR